MTQPFWEVALAKQQGKLINQAMDYSAQSRTAPVIAMQPLTPSHTAWQPLPTSQPAQTYAFASRSAPIVFRHPPARPQSARIASGSGHHASPAGNGNAGDGDAGDGLPIDLGARLKSLKRPPGWLGGALIAVAGFLGNQLRHPEAPAMQTSAVSHPVVPVHAKHAKAK